MDEQIIQSEKPENKIILSVEHLLSKYDKNSVLSVKKLVFKGVDKDVYNITSPFEINGMQYIAGRVESRESETDSKTMFFLKSGDEWFLDKKAPVFDLQDPFISFVNGKIIFGGVETKFEMKSSVYRTIFFRGKTIYSLKKFAEGPYGMKDIRLSLLPSEISAEISSGLNSKLPGIGIFTRPQGKIGGRGRIGFMKIDSIDDLKKLEGEDYYSAKLLEDSFMEEQWLGVNAVYNLKNGKLGVFGHIACFTGNQKNYYPIVFVFDHKTHGFSNMKIMATRNELPEGKAKMPKLKNVLFPGGLIRLGDGTAALYVGAGDAEAYKITIKDPFIEHESSS